MDPLTRLSPPARRGFHFCEGESSREMPECEAVIYGARCVPCQARSVTQLSSATGARELLRAAKNQGEAKQTY